MNIANATAHGRLPAIRTTPGPAASRTAALAANEQTGALTFAKSGTVGVDASASVGAVGLSASTTKLTLSLDLKAGQQCTFSFWFAANGPKVTLTDAAGKITAVNMAKGFSVARTGTYRLTFEAAYSLKNSANFDHLAISAKSVLPKTSGDKNIDALLLGGTDKWWHPYDAAVTAGTAKVSPAALGLGPSASKTALTYSFLSTQPAGQGMTNFQAMTTAQKDAVRRAFDYYGKLVNVTFSEAAGDGTGDINFGTNNQSGSSSAGYANNPNGSATKDRAYLYLANDQATNGDAGMQEGGYGWLTILHEIAHTLGLKHPGNYNAGGGGTPGPYLPANADDRQHTIMSYKDNNVSRGANSSTPMLYDIAALQYLYGANQGASTATNGTFAFSAGGGILKTLWSTNGTDTIDLSQLTHSSSVNLNAGTYSSINITAPAASSTACTGNNNVALAYGSAINAVTLSATAGVAESVTLNGAYKTGAFDTITSFEAGSDRLLLSKSLFGKLTAKNIAFGSAATTAATRIFVNNATGAIYYDADGSGTKSAAKKIAQLYTVGHAALGIGDIAFVA